MSLNKKSLAPVLLFFLLFSLEGFAQEETKTDSLVLDELKEKDWKFRISPYAWLAGMSTDVGGEKIRQSFNDLSSITNLGFQVAGAVQYRRWAFHTNYTYANLQANEQIGRFLVVDLDIVQQIWENKIGFLAIDKVDEADNVIRGWSMEALIGMIYWSNDLTVDVGIDSDLPLEPIRISELQNWLDLVVGLNFNIFLSRTVLLSVASNVGGFGIENSSKLYWDLLYANTFKVSKWLSVSAGYKTFNYDREDLSDGETLKTNVKTFGPILGVNMNF